MRGNKTFYRWLNRIFWAALTVTVGYSWYYLDTAIPDRISIVLLVLDNADPVRDGSV